MRAGALNWTAVYGTGVQDFQEPDLHTMPNCQYFWPTFRPPTAALSLNCDGQYRISKAKFGTGTRSEWAEGTFGLSPLDPVDLGSKHEPLVISMMINH